MKTRRWLAGVLAVLVCLLGGCASGMQAPSSEAPSPASSSPPPVVSEPEPEVEVLAPLPLADGVNALTGLAQPDEMQAGQRPVAVMVSNNERSLPQRGLAQADVLVEMLTEGGISRLMALYADYRTVPLVGPVRSTRDAFVQFALPCDAIMAHIGTSVYAKNLLEVMDEKTVDGLYLGRTAYWFDADRSNPRPGGKLHEYCWFTNAELIWAGMEAIDVHPTGEVRTLFRFAKAPVQPQQSAVRVDAVYAPGVSSAAFHYDTAAGLYHKFMGEHPHTDEDGGQLSFTNVVLLECGVSLKPDGLCTELDMRGGEGWVFTMGGAQQVVWRKGAPEEALRLFTPEGEEIEVNPGKSYVGFVPDDVENGIQFSAQSA